MLKDLTKIEKKTLTIWAVVALIILIVIILFRYEMGWGNDGKAVKIDKTYTIVYNYDRYYTVSNSLNKFYSFISAKDKEALLKILDKEYIKKEKIKASNVLDFVTSTDNQITYKPNIMCKKTFAKDKTSYLVSGTEIPVFGDYDEKTSKKVYYEVILYESKSLFSVKPITEKKFGDDCNG